MKISTIILAGLAVIFITLIASGLLARASSEKISYPEGNLLKLQVNIPCPGHAGLIVYEIKKLDGINSIDFKFPNIFEVDYNPEKVSEQEILALGIFKEYTARRA